MFQLVQGVDQVMFLGLSTETKPATILNHIFFEVDTGYVFVASATTWVNKSIPGIFMVKPALPFYIPLLDAEENAWEPSIPGPQGIQGPTGPAAIFTSTTVEVNVGAIPRSSGHFTVIDALILATHKVRMLQAPGPYTGKGTRADEAEMDRVTCTAEAHNGSFTGYWQTSMALSGRRRIGRVRGNIKFDYIVAT
jgi:hypothetical protein